MIAAGFDAIVTLNDHHLATGFPIAHRRPFRLLGRSSSEWKARVDKRRVTFLSASPGRPCHPASMWAERPAEHIRGGECCIGTSLVEACPLAPKLPGRYLRCWIEPDEEDRALVRTTIAHEWAPGVGTDEALGLARSLNVDIAPLFKICIL
jgi:hypothetical protein